MLLAQVADKAKELGGKAKELGGEAQKRLEEAGISFGDLVKYAIILVVILVVLYIVMKVLKGKKKVTGGRGQGIDVMKLPAEGPPAGPTLEFLNVPVRVSAVIMAPAGNVRELPAVNQMDDIYDAIVPGLSRVITNHKPLVRRWQKQLSAKGFAHQVFQTCKLPGEGGKGTPWCCAAGIFKVEGQPIMAGLIMRTATESSHGQQVIDEPAKWMACLQVK